MASKDTSGKITALGVEIAVASRGGEDDCISLTDIARYKSDEPKMVVQNWMRNRNTLEFLGTWERLNNPGFKGIEFEAFKQEAGLNSFAMTPTKWVSATNAIGIRTKRGRYGSGTFAHTDIAFEFASWISPEFKLYLIKDYRRLKSDEKCGHAPCAAFMERIGQGPVPTGVDSPVRRAPQHQPCARPRPKSVTHAPRAACTGRTGQGSVPTEIDPSVRWILQ